MQFLGLYFVRVRSAIANTDRRHWRIACRLEFGMAYDHSVKMPRLAHIIIDPLSDLAGTVALETHPDLEATKAARLLKAMHIVLIAFFRVIQLIGEIGRSHSQIGRLPPLISTQTPFHD